MKSAIALILVVVAVVAAYSDQDSTKSAPPNPASGDAAASAPPPTTFSKEYELRGAGILRLTFPKDWADSPKRIMEGRERVNVIVFTPFSGAEFEVILEVRNLGENVTRTFDIRASLMKAGEVELTNCVEQTLDIHDIKGPEVVGGYYTVTDKRYVNAQPKPGEYKYLTQGYAKLATMVLKFRLVSNEPPGKERDETVEMIRSARFTKQ